MMSNGNESNRESSSPRTAEDEKKNIDDSHLHVGNSVDTGTSQNDSDHESPSMTSHNPPYEHDDIEREALSRTVSTQTRPIPVVKVPRSQRSGLLGRFTLVYEAEEPLNYPRKIKWLITFWVSLQAVTAPMGSSIIYPALPDVIKDYNTTATIANLSVALYMLSMSIFPLWWSSFSETAGRRAVYLISFALFTVFNVVAALSTTITMFIVMRILSGGSSAAVQAVGAGTMADMWDVKERGRAIGIFYLGPLVGPLISPVIGGGLTQWLGWRSTQWFQVIYGGIMLAGILLCVPETHRTQPLLPTENAQEIVVDPEETEEAENPAERSTRTTPLPPKLSRTETTTSHVSRVSKVSVVVKQKTYTFAKILHRIFIEPLKITAYLRFPPVALTIYYASIAFGSLYFLNISVERTFSSPPYNFSVISVGLLYISNSLGYIVTSILGGKWVDRIMARAAEKANRIDPDTGKPIYLPEDRMRENAWLGAFMMPAALVWYGWTAEKGVFWVAPILANFFFGAGSMLIFAMATTSLTEFIPKAASNGVALNNFVRNIFSFAGSFLAEPLISAIGNGWLFTILGALTMASCTVILAMRRWGEKWRRQMDESGDL